MESITLQTGDNIITSGEILGKLQFAASAESDAVGRLLSASLYAKAEGAFTSAGNPCSLVFSTSSNDTNPTTARLRVSEDGHLAPMLNNAYDLGLSSMAFRNAYISEGVVLSDNTPASTTNKLYNNGGSLYFNGSAVGGGGGSYTAGSGITIDADDSIHVFGGTGNFKSIEMDSPATIVGVPTFTMGTVTTSQPLTINQTWNNASETFNSLLVDITNTNSSTSSLFFDFQENGSSKLKLTSGGLLQFEDVNRAIWTPQSSRLALRAGTGSVIVSNGGVYAISSSSIGFLNGTATNNNADCFIVRDAANTMALRRSAIAQIFRVYNTYSSATSYERAKLEWSSSIFNLGTEQGSAGGQARPMSIQTSGVDRIRVDSDGDIGIGIMLPEAQLHVVSDTASETAVIIQGASAQSANLQEWQDSSDNLLSYISSDGSFTGAGLATSGIQLFSNTPSPNTNRLYWDGTDIRFAGTKLCQISNPNASMVNKIPYFNSTSAITWDGSFSWDATNNRLGIGTSSPARELHVVGSDTWGRLDRNNDSYGAAFLMTRGNTSAVVQKSWLFGLPNIAGVSAGADHFVIIDYGTNIGGTTGNTRLLIDKTTGNVGIGEVSADAQLHVTSSSASKIGNIIQGASSQTANLQEWQNSAQTNLASVSSGGEIEARGYKTNSNMIITESGTSRTLAAADNGKIIRCTSGSAVTITVPTGLDVGFSVTVVQEGLGQVTFSASGTNIRNRQNHTKTAGTYAVVSLIQLTTNNFFLAGDTAL